MRAPTGNSITQGKHGDYNAVDYSASPNPAFYAPEDGTISALVRNNGDCGNSLKLKGATGEHGFCHIEEYYVTSGQAVTKGQRLAKMGYTGNTVPVGPGGRHLHWILNRGGAWVYPPSFVNETYQKGDNMPASQDKADELLIRLAFNLGVFRQPSDAEIDHYKKLGLNGEQMLRAVLESEEHKEIGIAASSEAGKKLTMIKQIVG